MNFTSNTILCIDYLLIPCLHPEKNMLIYGISKEENAVEEKVIKTCGRPAGRRKTAKIEIAIEPEVKDLYMEMCYEEGLSASSHLYTYIREFIKEKQKEGEV